MYVFLLGVFMKCGIAGSHRKHMFPFSGYHHAIFQNSFTNLHLEQQCIKSRCLRTFDKHLVYIPGVWYTWNKPWLIKPYMSSNVVSWVSGKEFYHRCLWNSLLSCTAIVAFLHQGYTDLITVFCFCSFVLFFGCFLSTEKVGKFSKSGIFHPYVFRMLHSWKLKLLGLIFSLWKDS